MDKSTLIYSSFLIWLNAFSILLSCTNSTTSQPIPITTSISSTNCIDCKGGNNNGGGGDDSSTMSTWLAILLLFAGIGIMVCVCWFCCRFVCPMGYDENGNPMFGTHHSSSVSDPHLGAIEMASSPDGTGGKRNYKKGHSHTNSRTQMIGVNGEHIRSSEDYNDAHQRPQTMYQKYLQNRKQDNRRLTPMKYQLQITDANGTTTTVDKKQQNGINTTNGNNRSNNTLNVTITDANNTTIITNEMNGGGSNANNNGNSNRGSRPSSNRSSRNNNNNKSKSKNDDKYASTDSEIAEQYNKLQKSKYKHHKSKSKSRKKRKKSKLRMQSNEKDDIIGEGNTPTTNPNLKSNHISVETAKQAKRKERENRSEKKKKKER